MMKHLTTGILFLISIICYSNDYKNYDHDWGKGLIIYSVDNESLYNIPDNGIDCYNSQKKYCGKLIKDDFKVYFTSDSKNGKKIDFNDFEKIGYGPAYLKYFDTDKDYLRILKHTFKDTIWIKIDTTLGEKYSNYLDIFLKKDHERIIVAGKNCKPVYKLPNINSEHVGCIKNTFIDSDNYGISITLIGKAENGWIRINITQYDSENYMELEPPPKKIINQFTGWIRFLDDKGNPKLWYYWDGY